METLKLSQEQMKRRIARFGQLESAVDAGGGMQALPDDLKTVVMSQTVYGLTSPTGGGERNFWDSAAVPAGTPNFGAVFVRAKPGEGAGWHVHRYSYENFIALRGSFRIFWNAPEDEEHVDLEPFDMISIPPGAIRRFEYRGEGEGLLLAFAYAGEHSIVDSREIWLPPCEIERIEAATAGKGGVYEEVAAGFRQGSAETEAAVTESDRAFTRRVADFVGAARDGD